MDKIVDTCFTDLKQLKAVFIGLPRHRYNPEIDIEIFNAFDVIRLKHDLKFEEYLIHYTITKHTYKKYLYSFITNKK